MDLSWSDVRALNSSQSAGFEELCSQIARLVTPDGAEFIRKGDPDSGVECYCKLEDGQEWGWQAKFFRNPLRDPQWSQLDASVKAALRAHPNLARYFVCVPRNRSDSRRPGITTEMQRWESRVSTWEDWAHARGLSVKFEWRGSSELLNLLSHDSQAGRVQFWFGTAGRFSDEWFDKHLHRAVAAAGPRYTPEIHVDVPLFEDFDLFGRSETAVAAVRDIAKNLRRTPTSTLRSLSGDDASGDMPALRGVVEPVSEAVDALYGMRCPPDEEWPLSDVMAGISDVLGRLWECDAPLAAAADAFNERAKSREAAYRNQTNPYREAASQVRALRNELHRASDALRRLDRAANGDLLIVKGEAGVGKTHLLCDIARKRLSDQSPTVVLMGQQFTTTESPWIQARAQLDLSELSAEQFVGALEAAAEATDSRALFMIDAINEGEGHEIWPRHLADLLTRVRASPWIGIVLSVRTTYVDHIVPTEVRESAYEVTHHGFADDTYAAVERFCDHYELDFPATPLLRPEFDNPLFLKTLCEGLRHRQQRRIPVGSEGISAIFRRYVVSLDADLARELDYDPQGRVLPRALDAVAAELAERGARWLSRHRTQQLVNDLAPAVGFRRSVYRALVDNGLLLETPDFRHGDEWIVSFGYEWFADHLIATHLIDSHGDADSLASALAGDVPDGDAVAWNLWNVPLEALSVLLPERLGVELPDLVAHRDEGPDLERAFLMGVPWRDPTTIGTRCRELIVDLLAAAQYSDSAKIFDVLVTCAIVPGHPLGAAFLDEHLRRLSMPDRDAVWSRYLYLAYGTGGPVDRLLDWAEKHSGSKPAVDRETATACATALAWMLTASHRFVRDRATKGLVALLTADVPLMCELIRRFDDVDDLYVRERVMGAAYGVAMRNTDPQALAPLADLVYRVVFTHGEPPVHILLRDYARGVIERALHLGAGIIVDSRRVEPPYRSTWPHIPDADELKRLDPPMADQESDLSDAERAQRTIVFSVMHGDFARYEIGTNAAPESRDWLSLRHSEALWKSADELAGSFRESLDEDLQPAFEEVWSRTRTLQLQVSFRALGMDLDPHAVEDSELSFPVEEPCIPVQLEEAFAARLSEEQKEVYEGVKAARETHEPRLNLNIIQRYVLWRVFALGWTVERFGDLDWRISRPRSAGDRLGTCKPERIGKKYQWIAYHEILAHISDHYQYRASYSDGEPQARYRGTWQLTVRDIDPSALLTGAPPADERAEDSARWWRHEVVIGSGDDLDHEQWLQRTSDVPDREHQLRFTDPEDGSTWIKLQGSDTWQSPDHTGI